MQNVEFNEEQPLSVARPGKPAKVRKPGLTERFMAITGIQNRRVVEIIFIVIAVACAAAAFAFATSEEAPPPYPYESPFGPGGVNGGANGSLPAGG